MRILVALICLAAVAASASDGVIEISRSMLPLTLTNSGHYILTENIIVTNENAHGIRIEADHVTIDLNGFTLTGPGAGSGPTNDLSAIFQATGYDNLTVRNGSLVNWKDGYAITTEGSFNQFTALRVIDNMGGFYTDDNSRFENCLACSNDYYGIYSIDNTSVIECRALYNGTMGIRAGNGSVILDSIANYNDWGFIAYDSTLSRCSASENIDYGFFLDNCTISDSSSHDNGDSGFYDQGGWGRIVNCIAMNNGGSGVDRFAQVLQCTANRNSGIGIFAYTLVKDCSTENNQSHGISSYGASVVGNHCSYNGNGGYGCGLFISSSGGRIVQNNLRNNDVGINCPSGTGNYFAENSATGNSTNYNITAGNTLGSNDLVNISY